MGNPTTFDVEPFAAVDVTVQTDHGPATIRDFQFLGEGRGGQNVNEFLGPSNSVVRGAAAPGRIFVTDDQGHALWDITSDRAKPVVPGVGYPKGDGRKFTPTPEQLGWIESLWGNG